METILIMVNLLLESSRFIDCARTLWCNSIISSETKLLSDRSLIQFTEISLSPTLRWKQIPCGIINEELDCYAEVNENWAEINIAEALVNFAYIYGGKMRNLLGRSNKFWVALMNWVIVHPAKSHIVTRTIVRNIRAISSVSSLFAEKKILLTRNNDDATNIPLWSASTFSYRIRMRWRSLQQKSKPILI